MSSLIHCIYASAATRRFDTPELAALLENARDNNARLGLTGMLLLAEGSFFQVLEGPAEVVDGLFARIGRDPRHEQVTAIIREPIPNRVFGDWTMGFSSITGGELAELSGVNDFFGQALCFAAVDPGRARKLLTAFGEGRWRNKLSGAGQVQGV